MYEIAVINPRSITRRRKAGKKGAKIMAKKRRRRMTAKQRKYFGPKRAKRARAAAPRRRRASAKRRPAVGYVVGARRIRRRKLNPRHVSRRRRHSNPRFSIGGITNQLIPAVYGAGGALVLDVALGYIPLPPVLQSGYGRHAVRIVGALGIGWAAGKFLRGRGAAVGQGALTVAVYGLLKDVAGKVLGNKVPGLAGDYEEVDVSGYLSPAAGVSSYMEGLSSYMDSAGPVMSGIDADY